MFLLLIWQHNHFFFYSVLHECELNILQELGGFINVGSSVGNMVSTRKKCLTFYNKIEWISCFCNDAEFDEFAGLWRKWAHRLLITNPRLTPL